MEKNDSIVFMVLLGAIIMLSIALLVIYFVAAHRKKYLIQKNELQSIENEREQILLRAIINGQEEERNRIARNLHDTVGAELSMLKLNFSKYLYFIKDTEEEKNKFRNELNNLDRTIENISTVCKNLYPLRLQNFGIINTFEDLTRRINECEAINCVFESTVTEKELGLNYDSILNVFRIFQEVLNNLIKHSCCNALKVTLAKSEGNLELQFKHNGNFFTNENAETFIEQNKGIGLISIQNRINLLKGNINYYSADEEIMVLISLPAQAT